jgi:N-ethylmaleimide reductase
MSMFSERKLQAYMLASCFESIVSVILRVVNFAMYKPALYRVKVKAPTRVFMSGGSAHDEVARRIMTRTSIQKVTKGERAGAEKAHNTLFTPVRLGRTLLKHRVVMAPLTRSRSVQPDSIPGDLMAEYYRQRASDGGLMIGEATNISLSSRGWLGAPGLYTDEQVEGWKKVVSGVYARGGHMFAQLWHTGRSSHIAMTGGATPVSASVNPTYWEDPSHLISIPGGWAPPSPHRALTIAEIAAVVQDYRKAAERAMDSGFEGVELHAANGYWVDQFLQNGSNKRIDEYGGCLQNRTRFLFEILRALISVCGADRVAIRIGPHGRWNGISDSDPHALFSYMTEHLNQFGLAYLHIIEPRISGSELVHKSQGALAAEWLRGIYRGQLIGAGGFEPDTAEEVVAAGILDAVAFGRHFIANPDLPARIQQGLALTPYDRRTFYTFDAHGYTDYAAYHAASGASAESRQPQQLNQ